MNIAATIDGESVNIVDIDVDGCMVHVVVIDAQGNVSTKKILMVNNSVETTIATGAHVV